MPGDSPRFDLYDGLHAGFKGPGSNLLLMIRTVAFQSHDGLQRVDMSMPHGRGNIPVTLRQLRAHLLPLAEKLKSTAMVPGARPSAGVVNQSAFTAPDAARH